MNQNVLRRKTYVAGSAVASSNVATGSRTMNPYVN